MYASKQSGVLATFRSKNVYIFVFAIFRLFEKVLSAKAMYTIKCTTRYVDV
jgi:hypothetical protein